MQKKITLLLLSLILLCVILAFVNLAPKTTATTTNIEPSADARVVSTDPDGNYGTNELLVAGTEYIMEYHTHRSYLKFSLSSLPSGVTISEAKLYLYVVGRTSTPTIVVWSTTDGWTETGITWNNQPSGISQLDSVVIDYNVGWCSWTVTSFVQSQYTGDGVASFRVVGPEGEVVSEALFYSKEGDYHPYLKVTYSFPPTNDELSLTNPSIGTQGCLAEKQSYAFRVKVSDGDGGTNINYVQIYLDPTGINIQYRWTESTDTFTEISDPYGYCTITSTEYDSALSGNQWTLLFKLKFAWTYPDENLHSIKVYTDDGDGLSDIDTYSNIYYVENDLVASSLAVNDYRCNPSQTLTFSGYLYYQGTSIYPPNGNYNVKIKLAGVQKGLTDTTLISGQFSISDVTAESTVGSYSYTVEFDHMAWAGSFSAVVVDRIELWWVGFSDDRINIGAYTYVRFKVRYDYDDVNFDSGKGSVNIGGSAATYNSANGWWYRYIQHPSTVTATLWDVDDLTFTDNTYGLTTKVGTASGTVITDKVDIYYMTLDDSRVNVGTNIEFRVKAKLSYDEHELGSGDSLTASFGSLTWDSANSWFDGVRSQTSVGSYIFSISSVNEATYGITAFSYSVSEPVGIYDKLTITYSANSTNPDAGQTVNITVSAVHAYDNSAVTFQYINSLRDNVHFASGTSFTDQEDSEVTHEYTCENASDTTYGITAFSSNTLTVSWANLFIEGYEIHIDDSRTNVGSNVYLRYHLRYSGNQSDVSSGTLWVNGTAHTISNGWSNFTVTYPQVGKTMYNVTAVDVNGETDYGQIPSNPEIIWDKVKVELGGATDNRVDVGSQTTVWFRLRYEYDDALVDNGNVLFNGTSTTYSTVNLRWELNVTQATVGKLTYYVSSVSGNTYGITVINHVADYQSVIWDRVNITLSITDNRVDVGTTITVQKSAQYEYDGASFTGDIYLNETRMISTSPVKYGYAVASISDPTYGITAFTTNEVYCIWDRFEFVSITVDDSRIDVGGTFELRYQIRYDYDDVVFDSSKGSVSGFTWDSANNWWKKTVTGSSSVTSTNYDETYISITDNTYGITAKQDVAGVNVITDRVELWWVGFSDDRINIGDSVDVRFKVRYDYDKVDFNSSKGVVYIGGEAATYDSTNGWWHRSIQHPSIVTATLWDVDDLTFTDNTYGLTTKVGTASASVITDKLQVVFSADNTSPTVPNTVTISWTITRLYDNTIVTDFTIDIAVNGELKWVAIPDSNITDTALQPTTRTYDVYVSSVTDNTYGITAFASQSVTVTWLGPAPDITPPPPTVYTLTVLVTSMDKPVSSLKIEIFRDNTFVASGRTDIQGKYVITLAPATYKVIVYKNGETVTKTVELTQSKTLTITVPAAPTTGIETFMRMALILAIVMIGLAAIPTILKKK